MTKPLNEQTEEELTAMLRAYDKEIIELLESIERLLAEARKNSRMRQGRIVELRGDMREAAR